MTKPTRTRTRRAPLGIECLEERTLLAGNLLADTQVPGQAPTTSRNTPNRALWSVRTSSRRFPEKFLRTRAG